MSRVRDVSLVPKFTYGIAGYLSAGIYVVIFSLFIITLFDIIFPSLGLYPAVEHVPGGTGTLTYVVADFIGSPLQGSGVLGSLIFIVLLWPLIAAMFLLSFVALIEPSVFFDIFSLISIVFVIILGGIGPVVVNYFVYSLHAKR